MYEAKCDPTGTGTMEVAMSELACEIEPCSKPRTHLGYPF